MAAFTALLISTFLCGAGAVNALVRREDQDLAVQFGSSGIMVLEQAPPTNPRCDSDDSYAGIDFVFGDKATAHCSTHGQHSPIETQELCKEAARRANATVNPEDYMIPEHGNLQDERPKYCFMMECAHGNGVCFYFNPTGNEPNNVTAGTPICHRPIFLAGTADTHDCPDGYGVVEDERICESAAECLGHGKGDLQSFVVDQRDQTMHEHFPEGCFVHATERTATDAHNNTLAKVYYNRPLYNVNGTRLPKPSGFTDASGVHTPFAGTPMCNVSMVIKCVGESNAKCNTTNGNMLGYSGSQDEDTATPAPE